MCVVPFYGGGAADLILFFMTGKETIIVTWLSSNLLMIAKKQQIIHLKLTRSVCFSLQNLFHLVGYLSWII